MYIPCNKCGSRFKTVEHFYNHQKSYHESTKKYSCKKCDYATGEKNALRAHQNLNLSNDIKACLKCPYKSCTSKGLSKHYKFLHQNFFFDHQNQENPKETSKHIRKADNNVDFSSEKPLDANRISISNGGEKEIEDLDDSLSKKAEGGSKCSKCDVILKIKGDMKRHGKDSKIVNCQKCAFKSCTLIGLALHNKESHDVSVQKSVKNFSSEKTKKKEEKLLERVSRKSTADDHEPKKSWFECRNCPFKSPTAINLMLHIKGVHKNEDIDKKNFDKKLLLPIIGNVTTMEEDKVSSSSVESSKFNFKCPTCPFKTSTNFGLNCHITKMHNKDIDDKNKPISEIVADKKYEPGVEEEQIEKIDNEENMKSNFRCDKCDMDFVGTNAKTELDKHIKDRNALKPTYKCPKCNFKSCTHLGLVNHAQNEHNQGQPLKNDGTAVENEKVKKVQVTTCTAADNISSEMKPLPKNLSTTTTSSSKIDSKSSNILLKCPKCTFSTTTQLGLLKHTKQEHGKR